MPFVDIDGITTHYEVYGSGPPLLMMAPGSFDATIEKWEQAGVWKELRPLEAFAKQHTVIAYDRRESGRSGGRIEGLTWRLYADQAKGLLDHLGIERAFVMGACLGVSVANAFAVAYPQATAGLVLHYPVGGPHFHIAGLKRFAAHREFVERSGLQGIVDLAPESPSFFRDSRVGPWASTIVGDEAFARDYAAQDVQAYLAMTDAIGARFYDRDTAPGAEPGELMALEVPAIIIPGHDANHATSAARYLEECLPQSQYWDVMPDQQSAANVGPAILGFLSGLS